MVKCRGLRRGCLLLVISVVLLFAGASGAVEYISLYGYGQTVSYCSPHPCGAVENCQENAYPCSQEYSYKYTDKLTSFQTIYDLTDSRILCGREDDHSCAPAEKSLIFYLVTLQGAGLNYIPAMPEYFRLYIPPGTVHGKISIYVPHNEDKGVVVRYKRPPEYDGGYTGVSHWNSPNDVTLNSLTQGDIFLQRKDGMIDGVLTFSSSALSAGDAGWLYFRVLSATSTHTIHKVWAKFDVDVAAYLSWYDGAMWDTEGDPVSGAWCTAADLSSCDTPEKCEDSGFFWYENAAGEFVCNAEEACTAGNSRDCTTPDQCQSSGLNWYRDCNGVLGCYAAKECNQNNLCGCENDPDCKAVGGYWYENASGALVCNSEPACTMAGDCNTKLKCKSSGFYWYDDVCNPEVACTAENHGDCTTPDQCESAGLSWYEVDGVEGCYVEPECNVNNFPGCGNSEDCKAVGGYWYEDASGALVCNSEPACTMAGDCNTKLKCESSDFYWYNDACTSESPCGPGNLSGCLTKDDCEDNGGEWHTYQTSTGIRCVTASSDPGSSDPGSSDPVVDTFLGFLSRFGHNSADECSAANLGACNQQKCEELGSGYWWYDGSCRVDERQQDYNGRIEQAPVRLGADADDGSIKAGDGLSVVVDIPAGKRGYALLVFPHDLGYYFIDSTNIINEQLVPLVTDGAKKVVFEDEDLCADLVEEAPEFKGEWLVEVLTVPIAAPEFSTLDDIAAYINGGGLYSFGSYSIDVHCREETGSGCTPGNLSCTNKEDCEASGGVWHNYHTSDPTVVKCEKVE